MTALNITQQYSLFKNQVCHYRTQPNCLFQLFQISNHEELTDEFLLEELDM